MAKTYKIPFAFDSNGDIHDYKSGKKDINYSCQCGETVRIRGGEKVSNHFYHVNETECSNESIIHKAYKNVFLNSKKIKLPIIYNGSNTLEFDRVELEKRINDFQPDAIGYKGNDMYLIEFAKTSFITDTKFKKIEKSNLFCLEVNIDCNINTIEGIRQHIEDSAYSKHIIFSPTSKELEEFRNKARTEFYKLKKQHKEELLKKDKKIIELENKYDNLKGMDSTDDIFLRYVKECKNGAHLFCSKNGIFAFLNSDDKTINVKLSQFYS